MELRKRRELERVASGLSQLGKLRGHEGAPTTFWPAYLAALADVAKATGGAILISTAESKCRTVAVYPRSSSLIENLEKSGVEIEVLTKRASEQTVFVETLERGTEELAYLIVADVTPIGTTTPAFVLLGLPALEPEDLHDTTTRVHLGREAASVYSLQRRLQRAEAMVSSFASVLDLLRVMDSRQRYLEAAMTLCNESAARFHCERVSLGWMVKGVMRLQAISHTEKIEKKMEAVRALEELMEEALDQDEEVIVPPPPDSDCIIRSHERFGELQSVANLVSLPLRLGDEPVAVLTLERSSDEFEEGELRSLRLLCDQAVTRLSELKKHDRWIGARCWSSLREKSAKLVGVEHTGWKLIGLVTAIAVAILIFGGKTYRVEAPFILKTDTLAQIPAAFDGYIEEVHIRVGDHVVAEAELVDLDPEQLLLQEASALAELRRHRSDAQRAEAEGKLATMRSAQALGDQVDAELKILHYRLSQAKLAAPFEGVVVEGDLRERIGAPVKKGEVLIKLARLDQLYVEGKVHERNIHFLEEGKQGEIAFASRPQEKFVVTVDRIEPLAIPEEDGNVFIVRCRISGEAGNWWRPGMSGVCKIETERRSYLWILTHRTVDFIRMKFWW